MPPEADDKSLEGSKTYTPAELQAVIDAAVTPIKKNRDQLLLEKKALEGKVSPFVALGIEPEEAEAAVNFVKSHEFKELLKAGNLDKLTETIKTDAEKRAAKQWADRVKTVETEKESTKAESEKYKAELHKLRVVERLRTAALAGGVAVGAVETAVILGERIFALDPEDGQPYAFKDGQKIPGKNGWLTPEEWVKEELLPKNDYLRATTTGPGGKGSPDAGKGGLGARKMKRADFDALSAADKYALISKRETEIVD